MDTSTGTGQPPAAHRLSDDCLFGFEVENTDDREYLADVALNGVGPDGDIKEFLRLSLNRGIEEWELAVCCATAMRDRSYRHDSLDGQDILSFLSRIYGVDDSRHGLDASSPLQRSNTLCIRGKPKKARAGRNTGVLVKKQRRAKNINSSPYWGALSAPIQHDNAQVRHCSAATTCKVLERPIQPTPTVPTQKHYGCTIIEEGEGHRPSPIPSICQPASLRNTSPAYTSGSTGRPVEDERMEPERDQSSILEAPSILANERLGTPELDFETIETREREQNTRENTSPDGDDERGGGEDENDDNNNNVEKSKSPLKQTPKRKAKSPYFGTTVTAATKSPNPLSKRSRNSDDEKEDDNDSEKTKTRKRRPPRGIVSSLPFPRLDAPRFGLIQEELASDPFRLLIAVTFLIRTRGQTAIPAFRALMERYPTPTDLANADPADVVSMIRHLGFGVVRAAAIQRYARVWLEAPPRDGVRYLVRNYHPGATVVLGGLSGGRYDDHDNGDNNDDDDDDSGDKCEVEAQAVKSEGTTCSLVLSSNSSSAWEIGHLTQGPYALDSWRIFCRDVLRGAATDWRGGGREGEFQPEWMRVLPRDKELRACLRWLWMQEGWLWDPVTGDRAVLPDDLRRAIQDGRVGYDFDTGDLRILGEGVSE